MRFVRYAALLMLVVAPLAHATLVTSSAGFQNPTVIDFSQYDASPYSGMGPEQIGTLVGENVVFTSTNSSSGIFNVNYGLCDNGNWTAARIGYSGLNTAIGAMTYTFANPVSAIGGFVNYSGTCDATTAYVEALDVNGNVLESYDIQLLAPIVTPAATDAGAFRGIVRPSADIFALRVRNAYIVLDDLTFAGSAAVAATAVPTTSEWGLLALGLSLAAWGALRARG